MDEGFVRRRLRCRVCGSRRLTPLRAGDGSADPDLLVSGAVRLRWRCRGCRSAVRPQRTMQPPVLWRRRRPIASWLFGSL